MKGERLSKIVVGICLVLVLAVVLPFAGACAPAPSTVTPTSTPTLTPTPTSTPKPTTVTPTPTPTSKPTAAWKPPAQLSIAAGELISVGYVVSAGIGSAIQNATGTKVSVTPGSTPRGEIMLVKDGIADFYMCISQQGQYLLEGKGVDYADLGPQSMRIVWNGGRLDQGYATRASAGIRHWYDLKGMKVATYPQTSAQDKMEAGFLFANLSWSDVIPTLFPTWSSASKAVLQGAVDVALMSATATDAYELASSIHGLYWLPMPRADVEGWKRYQERIPSLYPSTITRGPGAPADMFGFNYLLVAYDDIDTELAYWFTKQIAENYDAYKDKHVDLVKYTLDNCLNTDSWFVPWHEGSIKYFKEIGRWTPQMDALQQKMLAEYPQTMTRKK